MKNPSFRLDTNNDVLGTIYFGVFWSVAKWQ
jgi:hypothetical protein